MSALPLSLQIFFAVFLSKKSIIVFTEFLIAYSATFLEGSTPKCLTFFSAKFFNVEPSLLPIQQ